MTYVPTRLSHHRACSNDAKSASLQARGLASATFGRYRSRMSERVNLADPACEPSDDDLRGLSKRAFAHVRERRLAGLVKLRADIVVAREEALRHLAQIRAARAPR